MPLRIILRAQDAVFVVDIGEDLLLVGPVIAGRDHVDAHGEEFLGDGAGEAEAAGGILAIGDDEIGLRGAPCSRGSSAATTSRPGLPMMSPRKRIFIAEILSGPVSVRMA